MWQKNVFFPIKTYKQIIIVGCDELSKLTSLLYTIPGKISKAQAKNNTRGYKTLFWFTRSFLTRSQKFSHTVLLKDCVPLTFLLFKSRISTAVQICNVVDKSNCSFIHEYPTSKQIIISGSESSVCNTEPPRTEIQTKSSNISYIIVLIRKIWRIINKRDT